MDNSISGGAPPDDQIRSANSRSSNYVTENRTASEHVSGGSQRTRRRDRVQRSYPEGALPGDGRFLANQSTEARSHVQPGDGSFLLRPEAAPFQPPPSHGQDSHGNKQQPRSRGRGRGRGRGDQPAMQDAPQASASNAAVPPHVGPGFSRQGPQGSAESTVRHILNADEHRQEDRSAASAGPRLDAPTGRRARARPPAPSALSPEMTNHNIRGEAAAAAAHAVALATGQLPSREVAPGGDRQRQRDPAKATRPQQRRGVSGPDLPHRLPTGSTVSPPDAFDGEEGSHVMCCICCGEATRAYSHENT